MERNCRTCTLGKVKPVLEPSGSSGCNLSWLQLHEAATVGVFYSLDGLQGYPSIKFAGTGTHLNTWVERGTIRVKCLALDLKIKSYLLT